MLKVLIVDDEKVIRDGIKKVIEWENYGFEICGEAVNGRDGLDKVALLNPDLILVDIKMPGINGLEMIRVLRERGNECRVILLTGYTDFKYAKYAIELRVDEYLIKPIDEEELEKELVKVKNIIDGLKKNSQYVEAAELSAENVIGKLILEDVSSDQLYKYNNIYSLALPWKSYQVILLSVDTVTGSEKKVRRQIKELVKEFISYNNYGYTGDVEGHIGILIKNTIFNKKNTLPLGLLNSKLKRIMGIDTMIYIGRPVAHFNDLIISYKNALELLDKRFIYVSENIICYDRVTLDTDTSIDMDVMVDKLYTAVSLCKTENINDILDEFKRYIIKKENSEIEIKTNYINLITELINKLAASSEEMVKSITSGRNIIEDIFSKSNLQDLNDYIKHILNGMCKEIETKDYDIIMKRIVNYIEENHHKNLKLSLISEVSGYNSIYLGKKFKQYTGMSFNVYLDYLRISKAKRLLKAGSKVYDVAEAIGYCDKNYFYSKFKKYVGISPNEYKNSIDKSLEQ